MLIPRHRIALSLIVVNSWTSLLLMEPADLALFEELVSWHPGAGFGLGVPGEERGSRGVIVLGWPKTRVEWMMVEGLDCGNAKERVGWLGMVVAEGLMEGAVFHSGRICCQEASGWLALVRDARRYSSCGCANWYFPFEWVGLMNGAVNRSVLSFSGIGSDRSLVEGATGRVQVPAFDLLGRLTGCEFGFGKFMEVGFFPACSYNCHAILALSLSVSKSVISSNRARGQPFVPQPWSPLHRPHFSVSDVQSLVMWSFAQ